MKTSIKPSVLVKLCMGLTAFTVLFAGCSGGGSSSSANSGGTVTGVATPSKVSVVNGEHVSHCVCT
ncbi:MAG TPA: hypothetical protein VMV48_00020 [Gallionellaceae bacterium]|nr:hypothetical protein [Gallionellaceae bacterium]